MECSICGAEINSVEPSMFETRFKPRGPLQLNKNELKPIPVLCAPSAPPNDKPRGAPT